MCYELPDGLSEIQLKCKLLQIYNEYSDEWLNFSEMVYQFSIDDFYKCHLIAKRYLLLKTNLTNSWLFNRI